MDLFLKKLDPVGMYVSLSQVNIPHDSIKGRVQKSLDRLGVLSSVLLVERPDGRLDIVEGRGRVLDYTEKGVESFFAMVIPAAAGATQAALAAASLSGNLLRRNNPAHEAMALKDMVYTALAPFGITSKTKPQDIPADQLNRVFKTLSKDLDFDPNILKARWRLLLIPRVIMDGVLAGTVAPTVAVDLSKKPLFVQEVAEADLRKHGRLTGKMIKALQSSFVRKQVQDNAGLFDVPTPDLDNGRATSEEEALGLMARMIKDEGWTVTRLRDLVKLAYNTTQQETP